MELWNILVLGLLKQGINCDFDRLHDLTANHLNLRRMLGVSDWFEGALYSGRTLTRNVSLLTPELLASVNRLVVEAGHALAGHKPGAALQARADSFVRNPRALPDRCQPAVGRAALPDPAHRWRVPDLPDRGLA